MEGMKGGGGGDLYPSSVIVCVQRSDGWTMHGENVVMADDWGLTAALLWSC